MAWAAAIAAQIAAVLADVHRVDIVHRDIKPGNVMITDGGLVKVLDFGIAILRGAGALPRLTQVDRTVGTPAYMSPEQCLGQVVTAASDIYSLGCLLLELLTGDVPFFATADMPLRSHHLNTPRAVRAVPAGRRARGTGHARVLDAGEGPGRAADGGGGVRGAAAPDDDRTRTGRGAGSASRDGDENRDPTRPFRWPLLAPRRPAALTRADGRGTLTDAEAGLLLDNARALLDSDHPSEAISLLEDGIERAGHDPALQLRAAPPLGAALFYAGEYTRAAAVLDAAGRDYRRYFPPDDPDVLDCAYHAGHAYAETGKPDKALPQLRFYVQNADASGRTRTRHARSSRPASSSRSCWPPMATPTRRSPNSRPSARCWPTPSARLRPGPQPRQAGRPIAHVECSCTTYHAVGAKAIVVT